MPHEEREVFFSQTDQQDNLFLRGAEASFMGRCVGVADVGTHSIFTIKIADVISSDTVEPLLYLDGSYGVFDAQDRDAIA